MGSLRFLQAGREAESSYMQVEGGGPGCGQNRLCVYCAAGFKQVVVTVRNSFPPFYKANCCLGCQNFCLSSFVPLMNTHSLFTFHKGNEIKAASSVPGTEPVVARPRLPTPANACHLRYETLQ